MLTYYCRRCRRDVEVLFVAWDHNGPGLKAEYRCRSGHLFLVGEHEVQPRRQSPRPGVAGPTGS